jgi:hypothetical protein
MIGMLSCNNTDSITRFSEENKMDKQYYVYPSTLRMVNLEENEEFYELIEDFKKGQFFSISNTPENSELVSELKATMVDEGFEEAMIYKSRDRDVTVFLLEKKIPKIAAIIKRDSTFNIVQVEGLINVAKIPALLEYFDKAEYLDVLDVINYKSNEHHSEQHSQD